MAGYDLRGVLFVLLSVLAVRGDILQGKPGVSEDLRDIRKRYGAEDVIRDLEHIKKDLQKIAVLQDTGEISTNEALFYFLRMHDFDDNRKLDGHELIAAMKHSTEHEDPLSDTHKTHELSFDELIGVVDSFFAYDDNADGFISYPELRRHLSPKGGR